MNNLENYNYHRDPRVRAMHATRRRESVSVNGNPAVRVFLDYEDDDGNLIEINETLPGVYKVCGLCRGPGAVVNPSIDSGGISGEDWDCWDDDEQDHYMRGSYDVPCPECKSNRVVAEINVAALTDAQKKTLAVIEEWEEDDAAHDAECAAERAMGA